MIYKDKQGQAWFVGVYSNNFEDREKEIFTWTSHQEYAQWVRDKGVQLPVTVMHQPKYPLEVHLAQLIGLESGKLSAKEFSENYLKMYAPYAFAQTEAIIPVNGFMLVIAKILKGKEHKVKLLSKSNWGMSHGYLTFDYNDSTIKQYRSFEFTSLPLDLAANQITVSNIKENQINMDDIKGLTDQDKEAIKKLLNADPEEVEQATLTAQQVLQKVLASKELDQPEEAETEAPVEADEYEQVREKIFADLGVDQLQQAFTDIVAAVKELTARLNEVEAQTKEVTRSEDERIAAAFMKPDWASWDKAQTVTEDEVDVEALRENALGDHAVAGIKTNEKSDNPLVFGWMQPMGFGAE